MAIKSDRDWEAEDDYRTLTRATEIMNDKKRMTKAIAAGKKMAAQNQQTLDSASQMVAAVKKHVPLSKK